MTTSGHHGAPSGLSRRRFLAGSLAAGLGAGGLLAACGDAGREGGEGRAGGAGAAGGDRAGTARPVVVVNEPLAIDDDTLGDFEELTGLGLRYREYPDAARYLDDRVAGRDREDPPADVVILPDAQAARAVRDGLLSKRPAGSDRPLVAAFADPPFDPGRSATLPWQGWLVTLAYDRTRLADAPSSLQAIFERRFRGEVTLPASPRLLLGTLLLAQGARPAEADEADLRAALRTLETGRRSGQFVRFTDAGAGQDLSTGATALAVGSARQMETMRFRSDALRAVPADEGALLDGSSLFVTARDQDGQERARRFLDLVFAPDHNARIAKFMTSIPPVAGGIEELANIAAELALEPTIGIRPSLWARVSYPPVVPPDLTAACTRLVASAPGPAPGRTAPRAQD